MSFSSFWVVSVSFNFFSIYNHFFSQSSMILISPIILIIINYKHNIQYDLCMFSKLDNVNKTFVFIAHSLLVVTYIRQSWTINKAAWTTARGPAYREKTFENETLRFDLNLNFTAITYNLHYSHVTSIMLALLVRMTKTIGKSPIRFGYITYRSCMLHY